jgi:hypothetical protein
VIYTRALSGAEITTEFNQTNAPASFASAGAIESASNRIRQIICAGGE